MTIYEEYERKEIDRLGNRLASVKTVAVGALAREPMADRKLRHGACRAFIRHRGRGSSRVYVLAVRVYKQMHAAHPCR